MRFIRTILFLFISMSAYSSTSRIVLNFVTEENKAAWIKLGCLKAEQFEGTNVFVTADTTIPINHNICLPHTYGYHTCYEGDVAVVETIVNKMLDNLQGFNGYNLVSKKVIREKDLTLKASFVIRKVEGIYEEIESSGADFHLCKHKVTEQLPL